MLGSRGRASVTRDKVEDLDDAVECAILLRQVPAIAEGDPSTYDWLPPA